MDDAAISSWADNVWKAHSSALPACHHRGNSSQAEASKFYVQALGLLRAGPGRNPSSAPQRTLPSRHIKAIIPHLLVEKLGVWSVQALLPYTSRNCLVSPTIGRYSHIPLISKGLFAA